MELLAGLVARHHANNGKRLPLQDHTEMIAELGKRLEMVRFSCDESGVRIGRVKIERFGLARGFNPYFIGDMSVDMARHYWNKLCKSHYRKYIRHVT